MFPSHDRAGVALPLVRKVFGQIAAKEFVSVQPMNLPSGLVFYLDFQYGTTKTPFTSGTSMYGDEGGNTPFGNTNTGGLYGAGRFGYSINNTSSVVTPAATSSADWYADLQADSDFSASAAAGEIIQVQVTATDLPDYDAEAIRGFQLASGSGAIQLSQFTAVEGSVINFYVSSSDAASPIGNVTITYTLQTTDGERGDFEEGNTNLNSNNNPISIWIVTGKQSFHSLHHLRCMICD